MIRFANEGDIEEIMRFLARYWRTGHELLVTSRQCFEYEMMMGGSVNFALSRDDKDGSVDGVLGFVPFSKGEGRDVVTVLWKTQARNKNPILGMQLFNYLKTHTAGAVIDTGLLPAGVPFYRHLGCEAGVMRHYYRLNSKCRETRIAAITDKSISPSIDAVQKPLVPFATFSEMAERFSFDAYKASAPVPYKEGWYIERRYFNHPIYKYYVRGVEEASGSVRTLCVFRRVTAAGSAALRLVDVIGEAEGVRHITRAVDEMMTEVGSEYTDFLFAGGFDSGIAEAAGFTDRYKTANVIPHHFEPFEQKNIDVCYMATNSAAVIFKADGDQDRPRDCGIMV